MPQLKHTKPLGRGGHAVITGTAGGGPTPSDYQLTFTRTSPVRLAANRFNMGITFTQDTFPSSAQATAIANAKALMVAVNWDVVNMHSHTFGALGPWTNADKNGGATYASRATWGGWSAWDARFQHALDCAGGLTQQMTSLLPPGWCKMDGGSKTNTASDPLGLGRSWDNIDSTDTIRHTDSHRTDMVDIAKAIALRHSEVAYFSCFNEQKGNFMPSSRSAEIASDGLSNIMNYQEQKRYQEALRTGLDAAGKTAVEIVGPYLVLEAAGIDTLAATYAGIGFPQPAGTADATHYKQSATSTGVPPLTRTQTYLEWFQANVSSAARDNWLGIDFKTLGAVNEDSPGVQTSWNTLYPWRWYLFEGLRAQLQSVKAMTGVTGSTLLAGMESYWRKVQDDLNVPSDQEQGAMAAEMLRVELEEGIHVDLRWAPEQGGSKLNRCNLFSSTIKTLALGGGVALPAYYSYKAYADNFRGVDVYTCASTNDKVVTAVASPTKTLMINHTANPITVQINGGVVYTLTAHEVRVVTA